jgi:serine/threonine-protein kinase haspin
MFKRTWHTDESRLKNNGHTWGDYVPYSNVLWIRYLFMWLRMSYLKTIAPENDNYLWYSIPGVSEINKKFDLRTRQGFESAAEVLIFASEQGWITDEQLDENGVDSTILSQYSIIRD